MSQKGRGQRGTSETRQRARAAGSEGSGSKERGRDSRERQAGRPPRQAARRAEASPSARTLGKGARSTRTAGPDQAKGRGDQGWIAIAGRHPVMEALLASAGVREVLLAEGVHGIAVAEIERAAAERGVAVRRVPRTEIEMKAPLDAHQGVLAFVRPIGYVDLDTLLARAKQTGPGLLLVLDGIEDPQNLGALIRTCDAAGAHGVIIGKHRAAGLTEAAVKASAGAAYHVPVAQVTNIANTVERLKDAGYWTVAASPEGDRSLWQVDFTSPTAIVIGSEGRGVSRLVEERCDFRARLPMAGAVSSLNASVAGALFLYEAVRQRRAGFDSDGL